VILLDEIEKAHRDVFNVLLQVLDDGRLTDGHGRTVDFRNTIVVMTSNLGSDRIQEMAGQPYDAIKAAVMDVLRHQFRPEFINRIDETVVFHALGRAQLRQIVDIQIGALRARLAERDMSIHFTDQALDWLAAVGFDPVYGARPLKRAIQQHVENVLARDLLGGKLADGDVIEVDVSGDGLAFGRATVA
jgi:ATP-dependent Clp protease ATP-binding subunit ClpB